jgi:hypothetical protein
VDVLVAITSVFGFALWAFPTGRTVWLKPWTIQATVVVDVPFGSQVHFEDG